MKFEDIKIRQQVFDPLFGDHCLGVIIKKLKMRIYVAFANYFLIYDQVHVQFLQPFKKKK